MNKGFLRKNMIAYINTFVYFSEVRIHMRGKNIDLRKQKVNYYMPQPKPTQFYNNSTPPNQSTPQHQNYSTVLYSLKLDLCYHI